ncbi:MAG: hypothetical protein ABSH01_29180, partial [Terriglobia bacterium]
TTRLRSADRSAPRWLGYLLNGQLQGKLLSAYKISQAFPGTPYIKGIQREKYFSEVFIFSVSLRHLHGALKPN